LKCKTKAIRTYRFKKTKPISGVAAGRFLPRPSSLRPARWWLYKQTQFRPYADPEIGVPGRADHAKQSQFGAGAQEWARVAGRPRRGAIVRNKANFRQSDGRDKCLAEKELWYIVHATGFGKTKPILRLRIADFGLRIQEACAPAPRLARAGCTNKGCNFDFT
jgi:hypothetical protein